MSHRKNIFIRQILHVFGISLYNKETLFNEQGPCI